MSWASSGGASERQSAAASIDRGHVVLERAAHLERREHHRLRPARGHLAPADLRLLLALVGMAEPMAIFTASAVRSPMAMP